jgi:voltage-gated potassium channel
MYSAEHQAQPEVFNNAFSGIWWSISTILTVGYGDIYPITILGRIIAIIIAILGVGAVAIPTGIISAGFVEQYTEIQKKNRSDSNQTETISITIKDNSKFLDKCVKELDEEMDINVIVIIREGEVVLPTGNSKIKLEDTLVYHQN